LTVIGSSGTYPGGGRACSSYLVESEGTSVLLDCGNGALANLTKIRDVADVDAVILSHMHPDHFVDIYGLFYALRFHPQGPKAVDVYAPAGADDHIAQLLWNPGGFRELCRFREVRAGDTLSIGAFDIELFAAAHPIETLASRITAAGGVVIAYSADSGASDRIVECARDADLFVCDCTWLAADGPHPENLHMSGAEAGQHARRAGAKSLLVTHVFPTTEPEEVAAEAREHFDGRVLVARDLEEYRL
jgi:ribonuclease BN (tRNA processing enzyme)